MDGVVVRASKVFEARTETGGEHFAYEDIVLSQIFKLIVSNSEKIRNNLNVIV